MRAVALLFAALLAWPAAASAASESVDEIISQAVSSLDETCYDARMRYISHADNNSELIVRIVHCAPYKYRVEPLNDQGEPGNAVFIEDRHKLVRILGGRKMHSLPERRFFIKDQLTRKFLIDLANYPGTMLLNGKIGNKNCFVLRQDSFKERPYSITVGLDKQNYFPLLLEVLDASGMRMVYFEMEAIEYMPGGVKPDPELFTYPGDVEVLQSPSVQRSASALPVVKPYYPSWLPGEYELEAVSMIDYIPWHYGVSESEAQIVFHFEARGPQISEMLSIFEVHVGDEQLDLGDSNVILGDGLVMKQEGEWLVTVITSGGVQQTDLLTIVEKLTRDDKRFDRLLEETKQRDDLIEEVLGSGN